MSNDYTEYEQALHRFYDARTTRSFAAVVRARCALHGQLDSVRTWTTIEREAQGEMARQQTLMDHLEAEGALG